MKPKIALSLAIALALSLNVSIAQDSGDAQLLMIHEDVVIPAQVMKYLDASRSFKKALEDHDVKTFGYQSFWLDNNTFIHVRQIQNFAQLDSNPMEGLMNQLGEEATGEIFSNYNGTYHSHRDFVAVFHPGLSYKPELLQQEEGTFREWMYLYYDDKDQEAMMGFLKEWQDLYKSKGIETGYTVYTGGLGHFGPVVVVLSWAKDQADHAQKTLENQAKIGEEGMQLWQKTTSIIQKQDIITGFYMPDISYVPEQ